MKIQVLQTMNPEFGTSQIFKFLKNFLLLHAA